MTFLVLDKDTDKLIEILIDLSPKDIEEYEFKNPDKYIIDGDNLLDKQFDEDLIDFSDIW